jgi:hypothetical protein
MDNTAMGGPKPDTNAREVGMEDEVPSGPSSSRWKTSRCRGTPGIAG